MNLKKKDEELIYSITEKITGTHQKGEFRKEVLVQNIKRRLEQKKVNLQSYLKLVKNDPEEFKHLVSCLTIHTTSWFREEPHYKVLENFAQDYFQNNPGKTLKIWSSACSTGEEVYSIALCLSKNQSLSNFIVHGSDIDPISVKKAEKAIYISDQITQIQKEFYPFLLVGENKLKGYFTLSSSIRNKTHFFVNSLADQNYKTPESHYDIIFCRNVLIYFEKNKQKKIIESLVKKLSPGGILILGHCDSFPHHHQLKSVGHSTFKLNSSHQNPIQLKKSNIDKQKVLIVDDSPTVRLKIKKILSNKYDLLEAESANEASNIVSQNEISFITLDLNMPGENGAVWLQKMRKNGLKAPVVIVSDSSPQDAEQVFGALSGGAQDYLIKPKLHTEPQILLDLAEALIGKKNEQSSENHNLRTFNQNQHQPQIVVAGASTGGPEALMRLFSKLPQNFPPLVIVQHISSEFSRALLNRLCQNSGLLAGEIDDGRPLQKGKIYFAVGDYHLQIKQVNHDLFIQSTTQDKINGHRPSIDILFSSLSNCKVDSIGILLTGMGVDGAQGLKNLVENQKCFSLVQDASSSVVFGMPAQAIKLGAAHFVGNLTQIRNELNQRILLK